MHKKPAPNEFAAEMMDAPLAITVDALNQFGPRAIHSALQRHMRLDWGDMDEEDAKANLRAAMEGTGRVLSAFRIKAAKDQPHDLFVLTEADRSHTTILLPNEY
ncbi:hypothetical protein UFOVP1302_42 [uncultured Caudovirales phage]|uniref:Uncharacterized protein n=1 Tax=uncultured Caudovirales phage TaxID=2100421 RepID=A0A6J5REG2_9CAUD|nr:hypothetical protein UFOVP895_45 [uncultured Caudovirales phage]CAB4181504.1 hypothetical protein UFOVP1070_42 [uncultured Caudovirales phage]CAB4195910.1 hypothetical protein UFOVP1302_42 [uncultured Caudovirales phage]CAB4211932.1 hypothetical protein UFOVP1416_70 [uncultured Caudovirales phage]